MSAALILNANKLPPSSTVDLIALKVSSSEVLLVQLDSGNRSDHSLIVVLPTLSKGKWRAAHDTDVAELIRPRLE